MILRLLRRAIVFLLVVLLAVVAIAWITEPVITQRLLTLDQGPELPVAGGPPLTLATRPAEQGRIAPAAVKAAIEYGAATNSHALLVYVDGAIELEHYYPGYDATTITSTQSMHKSVLALLVGIAIDEGYIDSVDAPASGWIHEWQHDGRREITLRQLLQQTSGINFDSVSVDITSGFWQTMLGANVRPYAINNDLLFPPDTEFDYTSINPLILGIVLERATGMPYADYLSQALWQKIGAPDAAVLIDSDEHMMARTFCCLQATARAWLHLGLLHLNQGRLDGRQIVPAAWMQASVEPGRLQPNYGYLTWLGTRWTEHRYYNRKTSSRAFHSEAFAAPDVIYFDGFGGQRVYIIPSAAMVIVRTGAIATDWDDAQLPNLLLRGMPPAEPRENVSSLSP